MRKLSHLMLAACALPLLVAPAAAQDTVAVSRNGQTQVYYFNNDSTKEVRQLLGPTSLQSLLGSDTLQTLVPAGQDTITIVRNGKRSTYIIGNGSSVNGRILLGPNSRQSPAGDSLRVETSANMDTITILRDGQRSTFVIRHNDALSDVSTVCNYTYSYTGAPGSAALMAVDADDWDFTKITLGRKRRCGWTNEMFMGGIGVGFVTALGADRGVDVDMASSVEIFADLLGLSRTSPCRHHEFSVAFGIDWRNYRMTGPNRFVKDGASISVEPYPEGAVADFSRLKVFSLTFPFRYTYKFGRSRQFFTSAAVILKLNTYASLKTRYELGGQGFKEVSKHLKQKPVSLDLMASAGWKWLGAYVKYDPFRVLNKDFAPHFSTLTAGLTFFY